MRLADCYNTADFRELARRRLPAPVFHYIDGAADDEITYRRNTAAFDECDLVPNVLTGVEKVDLSTTVAGQRLKMPFLLSPTALQRMFHPDGERAVASAAERFGTLFGVSSLGTVSVEEIGARVDSPKLFQLYVHHDRDLNRSMLDRSRDAGFSVLALTVDTIVGGNRERDLRTGFTAPMKLGLRGAMSFLARPRWTLNHLMGERFDLPQLGDRIREGRRLSITISDYFTKMLDQSLDWATAGEIARYWDGPFILKGIMSAGDAQRAVDLGAAGIMVSNHGGRQLDGGRAPFDQLAEIVDAVGDRIDVICDGGIRRGTHILKALAAGAKACSGGRAYLYALAAAGQPGVERALGLLQSELERGLKLMGCRSIHELSREHLRYR